MPEPVPFPPGNSVPPSGDGNKRVFLTLTTPGRQPWLAVPRTRDVLLAVLRSWHEERQGRVLALNVLPDHVHLLLEIGPTVAVDHVISRWRGTMRRAAGYEETFQADFHGHFLHEAETSEAYALYIFLNPYRERLLTPDESWPGWWAPEPQRFRFTPSLNSAGGPPIEWVLWPASRFAELNHGE